MYIRGLGIIIGIIVIFFLLPSKLFRQNTQSQTRIHKLSITTAFYSAVTAKQCRAVVTMGGGRRSSSMILAAQLTLSQSRGQIMPTIPPRIFIPSYGQARYETLNYDFIVPQ